MAGYWAKDISAMKCACRLWTPKLTVGELNGFSAAAQVIDGRNEEPIVGSDGVVSPRGANCDAAPIGAHARIDDRQMNGARGKGFDSAPEEECSRRHILRRYGVREVDKRSRRRD